MKLFKFFEEKTIAKLVLVHGLIFAIRGLYLVNGPFDIFSEEAQYWVWSKKLDLSYYSKPPLIAYANFLTTSIFGSTVFAIKFNALILGYLSTLITYLLSLTIFNNQKQAVIASFIVYALPYNHIAFNLFLTDAPLCFFWGLSLFFLWKGTHEDKILYWWGLGISCGLGFLSKYTMAFFGPFTLLYLLIFHPPLLQTQKPYISFLITILLSSPVLLWNYQMDFVTLKHVSSIGSASLSLAKRLSFFGEYLGGQIGFLSPFLIPFLFLLIKIRMTRNEKFYLLSGPVIVSAFFLIYSLTKRVEVNWTVFAYFPIPILLANIYTEVRAKSLFKWMAAISTTLIALLFYLTPFLYPLGLGNIIPPKKDPAARIMGWQDTGYMAQTHIDALNGKNYFLFSESYHTASATAFFTKDQKVPVVLNLGRRKNQFDLWPGIAQYEEKDVTGIFVTRESHIPRAVLNGFEQIIKVDTVKTYLGRMVVKRSIVATLEGLDHIEEASSTSY